MKRLYSPWRSRYIASFRRKKKDQRCLFCRIAEAGKDESNLILWRGKYCFIVMNAYPYNSGHLMVVPFKHTREVGALTPEITLEVMHAMVLGMKALKKVSHPDGFNLGANLGRVAGAGIDKHVHFHIVPRWNGDTNFMPVLADVKLVSEDLRRTWTRLRKAVK